MRLTELLINTAFTADGQGLRLIAAGGVVRIRHPARTPFDSTATVGNLAAAVLLLGVLLGKLVSDILQVPLTLDVGRCVDEDLFAVDGGGVLAGNHDRVDGSVAEAGSGDFETALLGKRPDGGVGDFQREEKIVLACNGIGADVAEALRLGIFVNT